MREKGGGQQNDTHGGTLGSIKCNLKEKGGDQSHLRKEWSIFRLTFLWPIRGRVRGPIGEHLSNCWVCSLNVLLGFMGFDYSKMAS